jgi:hypothetical protein
LLLSFPASQPIRRARVPQAQDPLKPASSPFLNEREIFAGSIFQTVSRLAALLLVGVVRPWESPYTFNPNNNRFIIAFGCVQQLPRIGKIYYCHP